MRSMLLLAVLAACPKAPEPRCPQQPAPVSAPAPAPPKAPDLDDAAVISQSRAFMFAFDTADFTAFKALAGSAFVRFGRSRFYDLAFYAKELPARVERKVPAATRECKEEKVFRSATSATYIGTCNVRVPAH